MSPLSLSLTSSGVVNVEIEHGILQWELPSELSEQVSAYRVLVYREGHRMESPPMWVTSRVYNLSNLHLAAGTYYIEVSMIIGYSYIETMYANIEKTKKLAVTRDRMHAVLLRLYAFDK